MAKKRQFDIRKPKKGDSIIYKNVGYGLTSYEPGHKTVIGVKNGKLFTDSFDSEGMDWDEATNSWVFDGGLGLRTYAIAPDDPVGLREIKAAGD